MSVISDVATALELSKEKVSLGSVGMLVVAVACSVSLYVNTISIQQMSESIVESNDNISELIGYAAKKASTDASMEVVMYGLKDSHTEAEMLEKMKWWKQNDWGAQIGDSKNVCAVYPERLQVKMTEHTQKLFCRIALSM